MSTTEFEPPQRPGSGVSSRWRMGRTVAALVLREMSSTYGRSPGGYLWAILQPLAAIVLLSFGLSLLVRTPALGSSFVLFFATGFIPFGVYQDISQPLARTLSYSKALLSYPVVTWVDAVVARFLLNSLTTLLVSYLTLVIVLSLADTRVSIDIVPIMQSLGMALLVGLAVGVLNCALSGLIVVWDKIWSIVTRPLFFASGVLFLYEDMPNIVQDILWYNPLLHISGHMRTGFYPTYGAEYVSIGFVLGSSLVVLFMGIVLLGRYHREILSN